MNRTGIEWVKNPDGTPGYTWNPITGCLNNCSYCYAKKLANGRLRERYLENENYAPVVEACKALGGQPVGQPLLEPFYPRLWEGRFVSADKILKASKKPLGIFPCDMSDWCGIGIPYEWSNMLYSFIIMHKRHRFYLLTKQPQNLIKWSPFPDNCWVGVTATTNHQYFLADHYLYDVKAKIKFISFEPLLEHITVDASALRGLGQRIGWVIIGAQTKPTIYPENSWIQEIEQACDKAGIPVFEKNNLYPSGFRHLLRQELPRC